MTISRRNFLKGLGAGIGSVGLADTLTPHSSLADSASPAKIIGAQVTTSVCPFCGVGCGLIAHTIEGRLVNVEGDPEHPINEGATCSKGQAVFEVVTSSRRLQQMHYRAPGSDHWEKKDLEWGIKTLAQRIKSTRDATFMAKSEAGVPVNRTEAIASIGAASLNNEECYLITKLARALGIVYLEHQARL
ncbi:MAG: twin-arginine translocation signal domain-containing protein [Syntrophobacteraceae bacterium]|jgi:formate dehydrogenase major subunit